MMQYLGGIQCTQCIRRKEVWWRWACVTKCLCYRCSPHKSKIVVTSIWRGMEEYAADAHASTVLRMQVYHLIMDCELHHGYRALHRALRLYLEFPFTIPSSNPARPISVSTRRSTRRVVTQRSYVLHSNTLIEYLSLQLLHGAERRGSPKPVLRFCVVLCYHFWHTGKCSWYWRSVEKAGWSFYVPAWADAFETASDHIDENDTYRVGDIYFHATCASTHWIIVK